jgi:hypothetical protein
MWGALIDERTGLPFTIAAGPRQRSHSWVRVPWDSWPYFIVSDSRLLQPGGPGPRSYILQEQGGPVQVKVKVKIKVTLPLTVSQPISLGVEPQIYYSLAVTVLFLWGALWREDGSVFCLCCWPSTAQSFSGLSPLDLATIFYWVSFETSLFVASYDSQGHGGGIRHRLHTGQVKVKVTLRLTVSQSVSLGVEPPDIYYTLTFMVWFSWGALSDEKAGLSFVYAAGPGSGIVGI